MYYFFLNMHYWCLHPISTSNSYLWNVTIFLVSNLFFNHYIVFLSLVYLVVGLSYFNFCGHSILGAGAAAHDVYETLDIKHMQLDSLGYIHGGAVQATGQYSIASSLYDFTLRFFTVNYKDVSIIYIPTL